MKAKRRWIAWVLAESAKMDAALPWERGARHRRSSRDAAAAAAAELARG